MLNFSKNNVLFYIFSLIFFGIYFSLLKFLLLSLIQISISPIADFLSLLALVVINIPLSMITADWVIKTIKK